jgi:hypothetical protein
MLSVVRGAGVHKLPRPHQHHYLKWNDADEGESDAPDCWVPEVRFAVTPCGLSSGTVLPLTITCDLQVPTAAYVLAAPSLLKISHSPTL